MRSKRFGAACVMAISIGALAACSNSGPSSTVPAGTVPPGTGATQGVFYPRGSVTIPGVPPPTGTFSFDISFVDTSAGNYYLADRTTAGVDVMTTAGAGTYVLTAGKGTFTGLGIPASAPAANTGGPNGVVPIGGGIVFAGDGNSTLKVVNVNTGALVATIPTVNPVTSGTTVCGPITSGAGNARVDEMDVDPTDGVVLAINDAACPAFGTFFSTTAPYAILGTVSFPNATGGVEQPRWDPTQKKFIVAIPSSVANPAGEVDLVDPNLHTITANFPVPNCNPNGTALGPNETLFLGCSATVNEQMVTINAATGAVINTIPGFAGCDEAWYDPGSNRFYAGCSNNLTAGGAAPVLIVANANGTLYTAVATAAGSHSVAVDSQHRAWVPERLVGIALFGQ
jgi:hypothetical protein